MITRCLMSNPAYIYFSLLQSPPIKFELTVLKAENKIYIIFN